MKNLGQINSFHHPTTYNKQYLVMLQRKYLEDFQLESGERKIKCMNIIIVLFVL